MGLRVFFALLVLLAPSWGFADSFVVSTDEESGALIDQLEELTITEEYSEGYLEVEAAKCTKSSQCFSYEYCHNRGECVDAAKEPCSMNADCVPGESCNKNSSPFKCR